MNCLFCGKDFDEDLAEKECTRCSIIQCAEKLSVRTVAIRLRESPSRLNGSIQ
jgi:hypothetical protein